MEYPPGFELDQLSTDASSDCGSSGTLNGTKHMCCKQRDVDERENCVVLLWLLVNIICDRDISEPGAKVRPVDFAKVVQELRAGFTPQSLCTRCVVFFQHCRSCLDYLIVLSQDVSQSSEIHNLARRVRTSKRIWERVRQLPLFIHLKECSKKSRKRYLEFRVTKQDVPDQPIPDNPSQVLPPPVLRKEYKPLDLLVALCSAEEHTEPCDKEKHLDAAITIPQSHKRPRDGYIYHTPRYVRQRYDTDL
mmetsp:Transcript_20163/g.33309  ORF Transcript_20163/g.33309 Transcript_20163/m.33309 type:complete len:248 (+) Transcript_20163:1202-1945(+)